MKIRRRGGCDPAPTPKNTTTTADDAQCIRCRRCKRPIRSVKSVSRGCGWRCAAHLRKEDAAA